MMANLINREMEKGLCPIAEGNSISIPERLYESAALHCIPFSTYIRIHHAEASRIHEK